MTQRADVVGLDSSILMHSKVWKASGHTSGFTDPLVDCKDCKFRFRGPEEEVKAPEAEVKSEGKSLSHLKDQEEGKKPHQGIHFEGKDAGEQRKKGAEGNESLAKRGGKEKRVRVCPKCGSQNLTQARPFNLMFKTYMGPLEEGASVIYLRPETAQGIFTNFENVLKSSRKKIPFGIAQIGKAFRNEITPGHFIFRTREFEQMEMQYFVLPHKGEEAFEAWKERRWNFYKSLSFSENNLRWYQHRKEELAHYAIRAYDICYRFPFGWEELEGIHNRGDFDLSCHQKESGKKLEVFFENQKYIPHVIETSSGCDRLLLAFLVEAYSEEKVQSTQESRVVLKFPFSLSPFQVAILPLSKKGELISEALKIREKISSDFSLDYDESGSIGKRYRRQDEIGTPFCVTVDFGSLEDQKVTVRNRDSMGQIRIPMENLKAYLKDQFYSK